MQVDPVQITTKFLNLLGFAANVNHVEMPETYLLEIETDEPGRLIGRGGKVLSELQYLVNKIVHTIDPTHPRITLDVGGYRMRIRERLLAKAKEAAEKVRKWGDIVELEPMSAFDRWLIHTAFKDDPDVETKSVEIEGNTDKKLIILRPKRKSPGN